MDSLSEFRSIGTGPTLPDGEPSLPLATDNAGDGSLWGRIDFGLTRAVGCRSNASVARLGARSATCWR